jgi:hypothetical protein
MEVRHFFVREKYLDEQVQIERVEGKKKLADLLTKPLERLRFEALR